MVAPIQSAGFLSLPAELQIKIYEYVLASVPKEPSPGNLAPYAGLLLSCKKVASDFEYEWAKDYNARLRRIIKNTDLCPLPIKKYRHAAHLRILIAHSEPMPQCWKSSDLTKMTRSYTLRLSHRVQALTANDFFRSTQFDRLTDQWAGLAFRGAATPIDFRAQEIIYCSRPLHEGSSFGRKQRSTSALPREILMRIAMEVLHENATMEQVFGLLNTWDASSAMWEVLFYDIARFRGLHDF